MSEPEIINVNFTERLSDSVSFARQTYFRELMKEAPWPRWIHRLSYSGRTFFYYTLYQGEVYVLQTNPFHDDQGARLSRLPWGTDEVERLRSFASRVEAERAFLGLEELLMEASL